MNIATILLNEIRHRKKNFIWGIIAVTTAIGVLSGARVLLSINQIAAKTAIEMKIAETEKEMATLRDDMRKATLKLSFNLVILPNKTDLKEWHLRGESSQYMPEDYADKIANSRIVTVRHLLPTLQRRVEWPEIGRSIILVGSRGEVPHLHKSPRIPLQQAVPTNSIVLGAELQKICNVKTGDKVKLMDRPLTVTKIHAKRGTRDDITAWIPLETAQELLGKKGQINAIQALECICAGSGALETIRADISRLLPDTQIVERGSKVIARAESRFRANSEALAAVEREKQHRANLKHERERSIAILIPLVMLAGTIWIGLLGYSNVRERTSEIAVLRAIGIRHTPLIALFLLKSLLIGLIGGVTGYFSGIAVGVSAGAILEESLENIPAWTTWLSLSGLIVSVSAAILLAVLASWIPALLAIQTDPAEILLEE